MGAGTACSRAGRNRKIESDIKNILGGKYYSFSYKFDIIPRKGSTAKQGPNYNEPLINFVNSMWDIELARHNSPGLISTLRAVKNFRFQGYK